MFSIALALTLTAAPDAGPAPSATMRSMFEALVGLEPALAKPERLKDPAVAEEVGRHLDTLATLRHAFPADPKAQEPATAALSTLFARYAADTRRVFREGDRATVPLRVRTLTSLCFTCHARERAPVDFADVGRRVDALGLRPLERAEYLAATRQFDGALAEFQVVLDAPVDGERGVLEFSRALRETLGLLVRVKDDPAATAALLDRLAARKDVPPFLARTATVWRKDVQRWQAERFDALKASPEALFTKAKALVDASGGGPLPSEAHDVAYLRASGYLNLALSKDPRFARRGEALELLGICAAALKSPLWWDVDLLYFEACVRENAHTPLAKRCFDQLSDRLYFGFTGSAGTHLPDDELARLADLRVLAE